MEEAERCLKMKEKFSELIIYYEKKGLHEKGNIVKGLEIGTPSNFGNILKDTNRIAKSIDSDQTDPLGGG